MKFTFTTKFIKSDGVRLVRRFLWFPTCLHIHRDNVNCTTTRHYCWLQCVYSLTIGKNAMLTYWYTSPEDAINALDEWVFNEAYDIFGSEYRLERIAPSNLIGKTYGVDIFYKQKYNEMVQKYNKLKEEYDDRQNRR